MSDFYQGFCCGALALLCASAVFLGLMLLRSTIADPNENSTAATTDKL